MDFRDIVKNRKNEGGTIDDDLLAPQSRANKGDFFGRSAIKGTDEPDPHSDEDYRDDDRQNKRPVNSHSTPPMIEKITNFKHQIPNKSLEFICYLGFGI
jgi:deferrochelatase/peroxidase EfeB